MEMGESVVGPGAGRDDGHPEDCVFCAESPRQLKSYKTKHGMLKDEHELEKSLWSNAREIATDSGVGPIYPLPGGNDPTTGWVAKAGALEDFEVELSAAPHHIIPGKPAMAKSSLERWTRADKGKIKEDIGYSIDCAQNGIFLPHLPEIYWTREEPLDEMRRLRLRNPPPPKELAPGDKPEKVKFSRFYGYKWSELSKAAQAGAANIIMIETWLQMHYMNHSAPYDSGNLLSYDRETKQECDRLGQLTQSHAVLCEHSRSDDGRHFPPYGLVHKINQASEHFRMRITGRPDKWVSWVSPLARGLSMLLCSGKERLASRALVRRKCK